MQQYRFKVGYGDFDKGTILIKKQFQSFVGYIIDGNMIFTEAFIKGNPDIFEPVLSLEDEIDEILNKFFIDSKNIPSSSHVQIYMGDIAKYRNKIIKLFEDREEMKKR